MYYLVPECCYQDLIAGLMCPDARFWYPVVLEVYFMRVDLAAKNTWDKCELHHHDWDFSCVLEGLAEDKKWETLRKKPWKIWY